MFWEKNLHGYVWVTQALTMGLVVVACPRSRPAFPFWLWVPWLAYIVVQCDWFIFDAVQRTLMLLVAPLVAWAASAVIGRRELKWLLRALTPLALVLVAFFVLSTFGLLPRGVGYQEAAAGMTLALCAAHFAPGLYAGKWSHMVIWFLCVATAPLSGMRTLTAVALLTPIFPAVRLGVKKRTMALLGCSLLGLAAISLPSFQREMSPTGAEVSPLQVVEGEEELFTSGRDIYWPVFIDEGMEHPIWGGGSDAAGRFGERRFSGLRHPHNEYIRIFFDYGIIGLLLFFIPFAYCTWDLWRRCRREKDKLVRDALSLSFAGLIMFLLLAITDNVILYIQFYGCLLFCIMGAAYGLSDKQRNSSNARQSRANLDRGAK